MLARKFIESPCDVGLETTPRAIPREAQPMCSLLGGGPTNLDAEAREVAVGRADILDVTYLGRFTGIPNGALTRGARRSELSYPG